MANVQTSRARNKRSSQGCLTCVQAKVKCSEDRPRCQRCNRLYKDCTWPGPRVPLKERRRGHGSLKFREALARERIHPVECVFVSAPSNIEQLYSGSLISPVLTPRHIPSPSSVCYGPMEQDALYYFENVFSTMSPKSFLWSIHAILLKYSSDSEALTHLLLASCLSQMSQSSADQNLLQAARQHFGLGTKLLVSSMRAPNVDHCRNMMAFWLLQLTYRTVWDQKARAAMATLSASIVAYVEQHRLIELLAGDGVSSDKVAELSATERSVTSTFLLFAAYEDLDSEYCDAGGNLAAKILAGDATSDTVFILSRASHGRFFGSDYPSEELMDDIERSVPLELHFHANMALSRFQKISRQKSTDLRHFGEIERHLQVIIERYPTVFQLANTAVATPNKLMITTYHIVAHFYAIVVCLLKAIASKSEEDIIVQKLAAAKQKLLHHVFRMILHSPSAVPLWRNQWPVFIAATTAEDIIHYDWLSQKLGKNRYATLLTSRQATYAS